MKHPRSYPRDTWRVLIFSIQNGTIHPLKWVTAMKEKSRDVRRKGKVLVMGFNSLSKK